MRRLLLTLAALAAVARAQPPNSRNPEAVQEVTSGKRTEANAAWWGFNAEDLPEQYWAGGHDGGASGSHPLRRQARGRSEHDA